MDCDSAARRYPDFYPTSPQNKYFEAGISFLTVFYNTSTLKREMRESKPQTRAPFQFQLDLQSGVPVYRQIIDQVQAGMAVGSLRPGHQLPTVRQVAVDLAINPNTVLRAYRELEIRGVLDTQQGTGTFISLRKIRTDELERQRQLDQLVGEFVARAGAAGFTLQDVAEAMLERYPELGKRR